MCEQTEINYLDGDVVWVKLGGCWWPGQVTGFHNLPEDIQREFQKKPLIAAVKFFQEDTYEYVKNYQQIYKYNCTLKDEFIKKGLDKYRSKIKDGSSYMSKFPGDVEMAEKLTGGDPDILSSNKFSPEEKPDISALFGDKKVQKKRKDRDEMQRRSEGGESMRKITHPRFLKESDHEVRIRQQPSSLPSTPNIVSPQEKFPCHLCNFISSRVNVIICHIKSHRSGNSSASKSRVKTYSQSKSKDVSDTPKRKYVKKEKNQHKNKVESPTDFGKRKSSKQTEKPPKKKKTDPELREKLLADWDDESDEDTSFNQSKSFNTSTSRHSPTRDQSYMDVSEEHNKDVSASEIGNPHEILEETEKLLRETDKFASIHIDSDTLASIVHKVESNVEKKDPLSLDLSKNDLTNKLDKEKETLKLDDENKHSKSDKDDKKSRLSCFDFDEDDVPEPSIPPVRKIPRVFGEKNLSLKKEIIKEFELSQALKTEKQIDNEKILFATEREVSRKNNKRKGTTLKGNLVDMEDIEKVDDSSKSSDTSDETINKLIESKNKSELKTELTLQDNEEQKSSNNYKTNLETIEIFEVKKDKDEKTHSANIKIDKGSEPKTLTDKNDSDKLKTDKETCIEEKPAINKTPSVTNNVVEKVDISHDNTIAKQADDTLSDPFTTETEDETVSESAETLPEQSESSDVDMIEVPKSDKDNILLHNPKGKLTSKIKRKRGRPRKSFESLDTSIDGSEKASKDNRSRTSESDTDRSFTGRKRRPNKKYLDSDESTQDEKSIFKTDDSQSEGDERFHEKPKVKPRKGRKLMGQHKKDTDSMKQMEELELSEEMMEVSEDNSNKTTNISPKRDSPIQNDITSEISSEVEKKTLDDKITSSTSQKTLLECTDTEIKVDKSDITTLLSENVTLPPKDVTIEPLKEETELLQVMNQETETDLMLNKTSPVKELLKDENESSLKTDKPQVSNDSEIQKQSSSDVSKTTIDMLPPKKSQIKKFELSQLDTPSENTTMNQDTESQEEENKLIDTEDKTTLKTTELDIKSIDISLENIEKTESKTSTDLNVEVEMKESTKISIIEDKNSQQTDTVVSESTAKADEKVETEKSSEKEGENSFLESKESVSKDI
ncbi:hypothetical protein M0802_015523, partial [Mischocyttarus mexicanus]